MDVLPAMVAPRAKAFGFEPAAHRTSRDVRKRGSVGHPTGQLGSTPTRERHLTLFWQTTGDSRDLCADFRGKNASALRAWARQPPNAS